MKYVAIKWVEWSEDGRGNYWSDFAAYDVDGDGLADAPYCPNDSMDHVLWTQPAPRPNQSLDNRAMRDHDVRVIRAIISTAIKGSTCRITGMNRGG